MDYYETLAQKSYRGPSERTARRAMEGAFRNRWCYLEEWHTKSYSSKQSS